MAGAERSFPDVQTEAISAISSLSRATKDDFASFFHMIVQGLLDILGKPVTSESINLHVAACGCLCKNSPDF